MDYAESFDAMANNIRNQLDEAFSKCVFDGSCYYLTVYNYRQFYNHSITGTCNHKLYVPTSKKIDTYVYLYNNKILSYYDRQKILDNYSLAIQKGNMILENLLYEFSKDYYKDDKLTIVRILPDTFRKEINPINFQESFSAVFELKDNETELLSKMAFNIPKSFIEGFLKKHQYINPIFDNNIYNFSYQAIFKYDDFCDLYGGCYNSISQIKQSSCDVRGLKHLDWVDKETFDKIVHFGNEDIYYDSYYFKPLYITDVLNPEINN